MSENDVVPPTLAYSPERGAQGAPRPQTGVDVAETMDLETIVDAIAAGEAEGHAFVSALASGGMGAIELAVDPTLGREVALKRIHPHLAGSPRSLAMFVREARIMGQLEHPHIVPVHALGVDPRRSLFFTMKRVEGKTLHVLLEEAPTFARDRASLLARLGIVLKVCDALAFAHSRGVVHLDVKPANVMIGDFGQVYLLDWGVARRRGETAARGGARAGRDTDHDPGSASVVDVDTGDGYLIGTPAYMSPEQARGANDALDERTDVFAAGALVYHVLTGRAPYVADSFVAVLGAAQMADSPRIDEIVGPSVVPRTLVRIVERAMAAEPSERYASIDELSSDLSRFVHGGDAFRAASFAAGEHIVREGEAGAEAYILASGRCEITQGEGSSQRVIRRIGPGEIFGEMAILAPGPRTATVVALEPTTVHVVDASALEQELDGLPPWFASFVRTLAARFRELEGERARR